jgi:hypothetical protein
VPITASKKIARWHERAASLDEADCLDGEVIWHACWDVGARAVTNDPRDFVGVCGVGDNDNRGIGYKGFKAFEFTLHHEAYSRGREIYDYRGLQLFLFS